MTSGDLCIASKQNKSTAVAIRITILLGPLMSNHDILVKVIKLECGCVIKYVDGRSRTIDGKESGNNSKRSVKMNS